jgi:hypothetical protein
MLAARREGFAPYADPRQPRRNTNARLPAKERLGAPAVKAHPRKPRTQAIARKG